MLDIVTIGDEVLREKAEPVTEFGPELRILIDAMIESMHEDDGVGLAAPQVGVSKRLFVVDVQGESHRVFINPEIVGTSQEIIGYEEGCLSIPGVFSEVIRPASVSIQAQDLDGRSFTVEAQGLLARVVQHENDHLNGVLFIDRVPEDRRERLLKQYEKKQRRNRRHV